MNRFFSKLDLRDIKINPEGSHYPPDDDNQEEPVAEATTTEVADSSHEAPYDDAADISETYTYQEEEAPDLAPASSNGHAAPDVLEATVENEQGDEVLKVSARSRPSAVAGAIAGVVRELGRAEVQAIGAGATNQAIKAAAIARDYLAETGIDAVCVPAFIDVTIDNEDRTAIRLVIEPR